MPYCKNKSFIQKRFIEQIFNSFQNVYNRYKDMYGIDIKFRTHYSDTSRIRGYKDYTYSRV